MTVNGKTTTVRQELRDSKIRDGVTALARDIMTLQVEGSYEKARALIDRLGVMRPETQRVLDRLTDVPVDIAP